MKHKLEEFKDREELYRWASEKKDIWYGGDIFKFTEDGYGLSLDLRIGFYKKAIPIKTKKVEFWVNFFEDGTVLSFNNEVDALKCVGDDFIKTEKVETEIEGFLK